jgi:selenocysteine lyase/cysteine desulfurase
VSSFSTFAVHVGPVGSDFSYLRSGIAFLNHGSFAAPPNPVLAYQDGKRKEWLSHPDALFFTGKLEEDHHVAAAATAQYISAPADEVCLMSNATDVTATIATRWGSQLRASASKTKTPEKVLLLSCSYRANQFAIAHHCCTGASAEIVFAEVPFPLKSHEDILTNMEEALRKHRPRYYS